MSKQVIDGISVIVCDWKDPETGQPCDLGTDNQPAMFVDPEPHHKVERHFQCGRHHGVIPQKERPEFQLPENHKLNEQVLDRDAQNVSEEEVDDE